MAKIQHKQSKNGIILIVVMCNTDKILFLLIMEEISQINKKLSTTQ